MKSAVSATIFALAIAVVSAVDITSIPVCATYCVAAAFTGTTCGTDIKCACESSTMASSLKSCLSQASPVGAACSPDVQQTILNQANEWCSMAGSSSGSSSSSPSTTGSASHGSGSATGTATRSAPSASATSFDLSSIPSCADTCVLTSLGSTSCSKSDFACVCKDSKFIQSLTPCIEGSCNAMDQQKMLSLAQTLCGAYGVSISSVISASVTGSSSGNGTQSATTTARTSSYGNSTTTATSSDSTSSSSDSDSSTLTTAPSSTGTGTGTGTSSSSTSTSTGGAVKLAGSGFVAAAMGAAFFML